MFITCIILLVATATLDGLPPTRTILNDANSKSFKNNISLMADVSLNDHTCFNQLRVLTVLNEDFKVDLIPLYDEFMLSKN